MDDSHVRLEDLPPAHESEWLNSENFSRSTHSSRLTIYSIMCRQRHENCLFSPRFLNIIFHPSSVSEPKVVIIYQHAIIPPSTMKN